MDQRAPVRAAFGSWRRTGDTVLGWVQRWLGLLKHGMLGLRLLPGLEPRARHIAPPSPLRLPGPDPQVLGQQGPRGVPGSECLSPLSSKMDPVIIPILQSL